MANSIAIVGEGATGKIPFTYFERIAVFPTPESPIIITIEIQNYIEIIILFYLLLYKWSYLILISFSFCLTSISGLSIF